MATQSLYRRYRPRRFSELKGQDHVVRALRDAVASGREGQAYLFSGPRGTGKTTSARILAKVLNCDNVLDGEPCCECESCLAVERGTSYDVHELDAASNNGVDAIRDLVEKAALGTPGRHKVYILDEVHMLTKGAEAALLKTLEEPPPHVVFVLATTDPQKMSDTIRSRTQHLQFHLLPTATLAEHVKWVADDAGYELPQSALDAAIVQGGGSARDTLSALELLASTGGDTSDVFSVDGFVEALIERDPGMALTTMGNAVSLGHDPRTITEQLVRHLRNGFLSLMAPELVVLPSDRLDAVADQGRRLGPAGVVRAIERLGATLVEMRHAPDPRILVEVALVQLTSDEAGGDVDVLAARLGRLEHQLADLKAKGVPAAAPAAPRDPSTGRAKLGGAAQRAEPVAEPAAEPAATGRAAAEPAASRAVTAGADPVPGTEPAAAGAPAPPEPAPPAPSAAVSVPDAWRDTVKGQLKPLVRALYSAGDFSGQDGDVWVFTVPTEPHGAKCEAHRAEVEQALASAVGSPVTLRIEGRSGGTPPLSAAPNTTLDAPPVAPSAASPPTPSVPAESGVERAARAAEASPEPEPIAAAPVDLPEADEDVDLSELTDAPPETVKSPIDRLAEAFPGSELMADD